MMFEVGKEYWIAYGTTEEQSHDCIKIVEVNGTWLKVESDKLEPLINIAAPMYISARERNREVEEKMRSEFSFASAPGHCSNSDLAF